MKRYVLGFLFSKNRERVVLIRKNRPVWQAGKLNGVGGHIEENEEARAAMVREFFEETGVCINPEEWEHIGKMYRNGHNEFECHVYRAFSDKCHNIVQTTDEMPRMYTVESVIGEFVKTISNLPWLIMLCLDQNTEGTPYYFDGKVL